MHYLLLLFKDLYSFRRNLVVLLALDVLVVAGLAGTVHLADFAAIRANVGIVAAASPR
jgi:hypothetical protein